MSEGFSADWLHQREPFDAAARAPALAALLPLEQCARWHAAAPDGVLAVLDLACGSGANLRLLAPHLGGRQRWCLVDHDPALLAALPAALAAWAPSRSCRVTRHGDTGVQLAGPGFTAEVEWRRLDLARELALLPATALVTASAWLDLVSTAWLQSLIDKVRGSGGALLWSLSVDGRQHWDPADADDAAVQRLFEQHQHRDKGFGPALGPQAVPEALRLLADAGYTARSAPTDWLIDGAEAPAMQRAMIDGIAAAAREQDPAADAQVQAWQARRRALVGRTRLRVGHADIVAIRD